MFIWFTISIIKNLISDPHISVVGIIITLLIYTLIFYPMSIFFTRKSGTIAIENNTLILATHNPKNTKHNFKIDLNNTFCQVYQDIEHTSHISTFYLKWYDHKTKTVSKYQISHLAYKDIRNIENLLYNYNKQNYGYVDLSKYKKNISKD